MRTKLKSSSVCQRTFGGPPAPMPEKRCPHNALLHPAGTRCAAQAEYGRLAAQAYSPSDAISQAGICLGGTQKVQSFPRQMRRLKRGTSRHRIFSTVGWTSRLFPAVGGT